MRIPLTDLGLKVEKKEVYKPTDIQVGNGAYYDLKVIEGYNAAKEEDERLCLEIDREKLASILYLEKCDPQSLSLTDTDKIMIMEECYREADVLFQKFKHFAKVVENESNRIK